MTVNTEYQAWEAVNAFFPTEYKKDEESSARAGYPVYRSTVNHYDYFCMLGDRIEVNFSNGKTVNVWIKPEPKPEVRAYKTEAELREMAQGKSQRNSSRKGIFPGKWQADIFRSSYAHITTYSILNCWPIGMTGRK